MSGDGMANSEGNPNSLRGSFMRQTRLMALAVAFVMIVIAMSISVHIVRRQKERAAAGSEPVYNPYPHGILPSDLNSEIARVQREVRVIEDRALARWHTLQPPVLT